MVTQDDIKRFGQWYTQAHALLVDKFGDDYKLFAALLAATSPRTHVKKNWKLARRVYDLWKQAGDIDVIDLSFLMKSHRMNVERALLGIELSGPKVQRFYLNLIGEWDQVTVDVWVCRWYGVDHTRLTLAQYKELEIKIRNSALYHRCSPCEYQATVWVLARLKEGKKLGSSFVAAAEDEKQLSFDWR